MKLSSIKLQLILFLSILAFFLSFPDNNPSFLSAVFMAVAAAIILDALIVYFKAGRLQVSSSAVISGLIIGYVISSQEPWWKFIFASVLAIASKQIIRFKGRHLFNPAAFGIFSAVFLFHAATQWKGAGLWYIFVPAGIYFTGRIRKLEIAASYLFIALTLFGAQAFIQKSAFLEVLKYENYFFIFVMLIEPKTTPLQRKGKIIFGAGAGILVFILSMLGVSIDAELVSLLFLNLFVPLLNKS